ncbi:MAG TPA: cytochrome c biogenesis protein CcdA, partial [Mucilaginibacter sp.]
MKKRLGKLFGALFLLGLLLSFTLVAHAQSADTVSSAGVQFRSAPSDTIVAPAHKNNAAVAKAVITTPSVITINKASQKQTLWAIFLAGLLSGFAALLMPCIFPMLPLTVSYFTKSASNKSAAVSKAIVYGLSIIVIYVVFGLFITVIFGPDALNSLSTNGVFNFFFFLLLVIFAASFLGAFEITLPSSWANKMDANSDKGGFAGLFFMAATLALVSFSCTGPIIGTLLAQIATTGALLGPAIGMFGFAWALAIPFALFAMF